MQIAPGLHRIGDDIIAAYLLVEDGAATLVDAALPGYRRHLDRVLAELGLVPSAIRGIVLTHGDDDHVGFAERLRAEHGTPIFVHEADAARATGAERAPRPAMPEMRVGPAVRFLATAAVKGLGARRPQEVTTIADGEALDLPGSPVVIGMPGHSAGSIAVHLPSVRAVAVGDALTTRHVLTGDARPQPAPFTDDEAGANASLDRLTALDVDWVLPGHGPVAPGPAAALVAAVRAHPRT